MFDNTFRQLEITCLALASFSMASGCVDRSIGAKPESISPESRYTKETTLPVTQVFSDPAHYVGSTVTISPHIGLGYASFLDTVDQRMNEKTNKLEYFYSFHSQVGAISHSSVSVVSNEKLGLQDSISGVLKESDGKYFVDARKEEKVQLSATLQQK